MQTSAVNQTAIHATEPLAQRLRGLLPGLTLAALLALLATLVADSLGRSIATYSPMPVSPIVIAIVLGVYFYFFAR